MTILAILMPLAFLLSISFVGAYLWAASRGQYDDLETPAHRIFIEAQQICATSTIDDERERKKK